MYVATILAVASPTARKERLRIAMSLWKTANTIRAAISM